VHGDNCGGLTCDSSAPQLSKLRWLTDADAHLEKIAIPFFDDRSTAAAVHEGFYRNVRATRYEVIATLQRAFAGEPFTDADHVCCASHPISMMDAPRLEQMQALYITGHSLGAMAALMALMLMTEPQYAHLAETLRAVYTFGQPMIGDDGLAHAFSAKPKLRSRVLRYIYRNDVVPHLPPRASGEFAHFGREFRFTGTGGWPEQTSPARQMRGLLGILVALVAFVAPQFDRFRRIHFTYSLDAHEPQHYITHLTTKRTPTEFGDYQLADQSMSPGS
jgi:hypothetical protein